MCKKLNKIFIHLVFSVILIGSLLGCSLDDQKQKELKAGNLDISEEKLEAIGPVTLDGEWEFYWGQLVAPSDLSSKNITPSIVAVPDTWRNYQLEEKTTEKYGYATYRLKIHTNENEIGKIVSLYMPSIATAYDL